MDWSALIFIVVVAAYLIAAIRLANEHERFAVYALGRLVRLKGPGIVLKMPGGSTELVRVSLGAEGEVQSNEFVSFAGRVLPFSAKSAIRAGSKVRIVGFGPSAVEVEPMQHYLVCEKCGHKNTV